MLLSQQSSCLRKSLKNVEGLFKPEDSMTLFRKLFLFAEFANGKYFVPSLLQMLHKEDVPSYCVSMDSLVFLLVLHFSDKPPHRGIFCSVVCFLTSPENHHPWHVRSVQQSNAIFAGLHKAIITLGCTNSIPSLAFLCPCGTGEPHPATIGDGF